MGVMPIQAAIYFKNKENGVDVRIILNTPPDDIWANTQFESNVVDNRISLVTDGMNSYILGVLIARGAKLPSSNQEGELVKRNRISK